MIGVVIPAHDEESLISACLYSVQRAARCRRLREPVYIVVAADACKDRTESMARRAGAYTIRLDARNVGAARRLGACEALAAGARWLAFTDADTRVAPDWLSAQLEERSDVVCGTVEVEDWSAHSTHVRQQHLATYQDRHGHRHIHGANLGVDAEHYRRAGGFPPLRCHEDVALVQQLQRQGARIAWSARPRVLTSARHDHRAPQGFGATLLRMATRPSETLAVPQA
jgi:glycosyltransferase involved in cell wall biosynthesis